MAKKTVAEETAALTTQGTKEIASYDYGDDAADAGQVAPGYEGQTNEDTSLPFIKFCQSGTPEVTDGSHEGLAAGMWLNGVTGRIFKNPKGLLIIPCSTRHEYIEYIPRDAGGGFVARYAIDDPVVAEAKKNSKSFGEYFVGTNELVETFNVFGVACEEDEPVPLGMCVVPFKSSMIKAYKNWMTQIRQHTITINGKKKMPPMFAHLARLTSEGVKKDNYFYHRPIYTPAINGSVAQSLLDPTDERFQMAKMCKDLVDSGVAKVNYEKQTNDGAGPSTGDGKSPF